MKLANSLVTGILTAVALLTAVGCSKPNPVAVDQPPPVRTPPPGGTPAPAPTKSAAVANTAKQAPNTPAPAKSKTMPPEVREELTRMLARLEDALFDYDRSTIRSDAGNALRNDVAVIRRILSEYPSQKLLIEGHADERGSAEYNLALGDRRAQSVRDFLGSMGVPNSQLTVVSYGKEKPICTEESEECWQRNRRAHLTAAP